MRLAILCKTAAEQCRVVGLLVVGAAIFPFGSLHALSAFPFETFAQIFETPFLQTILKVLTGAEFHGAPSMAVMGAFLFAHPIMLAIGWSTAAIGATRSLAGEIETGTVDLLLAMPETRLGVYTSVSLWVFVSTLMIPLSGWGGLWLGAQWVDLPEPLPLWTYHLVVINSMAMLAAVCGLSLLASAVSSRRGKALGVVFGILLGSLFLNSLAALWPAAEPLSYLSILRYFRPIAIIRNDSMIWGDVLVLLIIAGVSWGAGAVCFVRRDIHAS